MSVYKNFVLLIEKLAAGPFVADAFEMNGTKVSGKLAAVSEHLCGYNE